MDVVLNCKNSFEWVPKGLFRILVRVVFFHVLFPKWIFLKSIFRPKFRNFLPFWTSWNFCLQNKWNLRTARNGFSKIGYFWFTMISFNWIVFLLPVNRNSLVSHGKFWKILKSVPNLTNYRIRWWYRIFDIKNSKRSYFQSCFLSLHSKKIVFEDHQKF